jgi:hypothetical protein
MGALLALTFIVFQANNIEEDRTGVATSMHAVEHGADIQDYHALCTVDRGPHCIVRDIKPNGELEDK